MHIFVVTNDFPPRVGGINYYVDQLFRQFVPGSVTVFASKFRGWEAFDATYPHEVVRIDTEMMLPVPWVRRRLQAELRARRPDVVLFGATWPLGHMGPAVLRKTGTPYGGFTHGLELTGALVPGLLRHIGRDALLLTAVSRWAAGRLGRAFGWEGRMALLPSGVDVDAFHPGVSDAAVRARYGLGQAPVVCCVSRLVARKGQDLLIRALPLVHRHLPDARLLVVGGGPYADALRRLAARSAARDRIVFTGEVPYADLPACFRAGDVFAMPCRSRLGGLDIEALGAVFLQAAAAGRPVLAGDSGGAPEAVREGETGYVVDPHRPEPLAERIAQLLGNPARAEAMGARGAEWIRTEWTWAAMANRLRTLLTDALHRPATSG